MAVSLTVKFKKKNQLDNFHIFECVTRSSGTKLIIVYYIFLLTFLLRCILCTTEWWR